MWIPGDFFGVKRLLNAHQEILDFVEVQLKEHERTFDANITRDYIDAFISEMKRQEGVAGSTFTCEKFNKLSILKIIITIYKYFLMHSYVLTES